jgi:hypothetical protein
MRGLAWTGHADGCTTGDDDIILTGTGHARCASCGAGLEEAACETCGGEGAIEVDVPDRRGEHTTRRFPCPVCAGGDELAAADVAEIRADMERWDDDE